MHPSYFETTLLMLILATALGMFYQVYLRMERQKFLDRRNAAWIEGRLQQPAEEHRRLSDQPSWFISYCKYNSFADGDEAICRAVTWAHFSQQITGSITYEEDYSQKSDEARSCSETLIVCHHQNSFLLIESFQPYSKS